MGFNSPKHNHFGRRTELLVIKWLFFAFIVDENAEHWYYPNYDFTRTSEPVKLCTKGIFFKLFPGPLNALIWCLSLDWILPISLNSRFFSSYQNEFLQLPVWKNEAEFTKQREILFFGFFSYTVILWNNIFLIFSFKCKFLSQETWK